MRERDEGKEIQCEEEKSAGNQKRGERERNVVRERGENSSVRGGVGNVREKRRVRGVYSRCACSVWKRDIECPCRRER